MSEVPSSVPAEEPRKEELTPEANYEEQQKAKELKRLKDGLSHVKLALQEWSRQYDCAEEAKHFLNGLEQSFKEDPARYARWTEKLTDALYEYPSLSETGVSEFKKAAMNTDPQDLALHFIRGYKAYQEINAVEIPERNYQRIVNDLADFKKVTFYSRETKNGGVQAMVESVDSEGQLRAAYSWPLVKGEKPAEPIQENPEDLLTDEELEAIEAEEEALALEEERLAMEEEWALEDMEEEEGERIWAEAMLEQLSPAEVRARLTDQIMNGYGEDHEEYDEVSAILRKNMMEDDMGDRLDAYGIGGPGSFLTDDERAALENMSDEEIRQFAVDVYIPRMEQENPDALVILGGD